MARDFSPSRNFLLLFILWSLVQLRFVLLFHLNYSHLLHSSLINLLRIMFNFRLRWTWNMTFDVRNILRFTIRLLITNLISNYFKFSFVSLWSYRSNINCMTWSFCIYFNNFAGARHKKLRNPAALFIYYLWRSGQIVNCRSLIQIFLKTWYFGLRFDYLWIWRYFIKLSRSLYKRPWKNLPPAFMGTNHILVVIWFVKIKKVCWEFCSLIV